MKKFRCGVYRFSSDVVSRLAALALQAVRGDHDGSSVEYVTCGNPAEQTVTFG